MYTELSDTTGGGGVADVGAGTLLPHRASRIGVRASKRAARAVALRSQPLLEIFGALCARDLAKNFHRVRLLGELPRVEGPMVLFANHPSWWDAEVFGWLATHVFGDRRGFAPMDAPNLERYRLLERLGVFPVMPGAFAGASDFLAAADLVLSMTDGLLLVTTEGRFRDVRIRPIAPMPGLAHLARRVPSATFVPIALDYVFWSERRPNLLLTFGAPVAAAELAALPTGAATARIAAALDAAMSALAVAGQSRDPTRFRTLLKGRDGMSFWFDLWRRAQALAKGQRFVAAHRVEP